MQLTTLCYLRRGEEYLLLHRIRKENDLNRGKWIGVGGRFEEGESPEDCLLREVREETGLTLTGFSFRGIVTFVSDVGGTEYMHLFTADAWEGELTDCPEGVLKWVPESGIDALPQWEGDRIFFRLIREDAPFFSLKLCYEGDALIRAELNGRPLPFGTEGGNETDGKKTI